MANQFRVSSRAASTALDVLPLASVGASVEVKEHVEWMARQARKAGYEVDPDDIRVVEAVKPVLAELEKGVAPGKVDSEVGFENSSQEKKEDGNEGRYFYLRFAAPSSVVCELVQLFILMLEPSDLLFETHYFSRQRFNLTGSSK
ncbi:hypothetical protein ACFX2I_019621 [Malus domestica]